MARLGLNIRSQLSPDLVAMMEYLTGAIDRFVQSNMMNGDLRVVALARLFDEVTRLGPKVLFTADYRKGVVVVEPSDRLLDLVAKFRAVEYALRIRRPAT